jgi:hypothetical protein
MCNNWDSRYQPFMDHHLVLVKLTHLSSPAHGKGHWSLPLWLLEHKPFIESVEEYGQNLLNLIEVENNDKNSSNNPQILLHEFTQKVTSIAKSTACTTSGKLLTSTNKLKKEYRSLLNTPKKYDDDNDGRAATLDSI